MIYRRQGKVIFSQRGLPTSTYWRLPTRGVYLLAGGSLCRRVSVQGGHCPGGSLFWESLPGRGCLDLDALVGTHPTGILFCFLGVLMENVKYVRIVIKLYVFFINTVRQTLMVEVQILK